MSIRCPRIAARELVAPFSIVASQYSYKEKIVSKKSNFIIKVEFSPTQARIALVMLFDAAQSVDVHRQGRTEGCQEVGGSALLREVRPCSMHNGTGDGLPELRTPPHETGQQPNTWKEPPHDARDNIFSEPVYMASVQ